MVATLDVVIEAISGEVNVLSEKLLAAVTEAVKQYRPPHAPKLAYIYTSGSWVHGENRKDVISDTTPITQSVDLVAWRPTLEQKVVTNPVLNGIVIRPALLYGRSASILGMLFKTADEGKVKWFGAPGGRYALIHQDDLGELYRLAAEKSAIVGGLLFDAANDFTESVDDVLQKLVEVSGAQGYEYIRPTNRTLTGLFTGLQLTIYQTYPVFEKAITTTLLLRPYLARSLLGWQPRKAGLVDHLEIYYNAWKATAGSATVSSDFIR